MDELTEAVIGAMQHGLEFTPRPFARIAERLGTDEQTIIDTVEKLQASGTIKRFGVVVRHRALGYRANGMLVLDIPDATVSSIAGRLAAHPAVTLCYRRPRRLPDWPYNLFCMIHGRDRDGVRSTVSRMLKAIDIESVPNSILFSRQQFKQRGAVYVSSCQIESAAANG